MIFGIRLDEAEALMAAKVFVTDEIAAAARWD